MSETDYKRCEHGYHPMPLCPECKAKSSELAAMPCSPPWDQFAMDALESHAKALKAKCEEITHRCLLPTVTDYTVGMALRELQAANDPALAQSGGEETKSKESNA